MLNYKLENEVYEAINVTHESIPDYLPRYGVGRITENGIFIVYTGRFDNCYSRFQTRDDLALVDTDCKELTEPELTRLKEKYSIKERSLYDAIKDGNQEEAQEISSQNTFKII